MTGSPVHKWRGLTGLVFDRNLLNDRPRLDITRLGLSGLLLFLFLVPGGFGGRRSGGVKRGSTHRDSESGANENSTLILGNERLNAVDEALS